MSSRWHIGSDANTSAAEIIGPRHRATNQRTHWDLLQTSNPTHITTKQAVCRVKLLTRGWTLTNPVWLFIDGEFCRSCVIFSCCDWIHCPIYDWLSKCSVLQWCHRSNSEPLRWLLRIVEDLFWNKLFYIWIYEVGGTSRGQTCVAKHCHL